MSKRGFTYYAVKRGRRPGIYKTWEECFSEVNRYPQAKFKGFRTLREAKAFMHAPEPEPHRAASSIRRDDSSQKIVTIYTDGGCIGNPGPGGYGVVMLYGNRRKELTGGFRRTTNNRMEMMAAIVGLQTLKRPCRVVVYTDSQYLVDSIKKGWAKRWRKRGWMRWNDERAANADLWAQLLDLCDQHDVTFKWIRSHAGTEENERCDQLAIQSASCKDLPADTGYENEMNLNSAIHHEA